MNWKLLNDPAGLDEIYQRSHQVPVLIYKHSTRCSISDMVLGRLERSWNPEEVSELEVYFLDLIAYRQISNEVADRFGVYHESPQILLLVGGKCVFDTSHMGISFSAIKEALGAVSA